MRITPYLRKCLEGASIPINIPEVEGGKVKSLLIFGENITPVLCDPEEILECDTSECALELFNTCIKGVIKVQAKNISIETIKLIKGGKVIVYVVDNEKYYLCVHSIQGDALKLCKS
jgi:hypothetical protein